MGTLIGHVAPGFGFLLIGLWHLFNHIKLHSLNPKTYTSHAWFPSSTFKYLEPTLIMLGSIASISMELFIGPERHQPLDDDWTIPSNHLHNFEHSSISLTFLTYALFIIIIDRVHLRDHSVKLGLVQLIAAAAFGQQLLMFHLHSADHMGIEGQYHWLLQLVIVVSLSTTLIGLWKPRSFLVSFVRSISIAFQGVWFMIMGYALWTPWLIAKGCFMNSEDGHKVVRCKDEGSLHRAKSLVNIQFSWCIVGVVIFSLCFYLGLMKLWGEEGKGEYVGLDKRVDEFEEDLESNESDGFVNMGKGMRNLELER